MLTAALGSGAEAQPPPPGPPNVVDEVEPVATLPDGTRRVRGRIVTPRDSALTGVPGVWVTLHRVGRDAAGPLDSVRTDARGAYALTYRPAGDARAVYFVAASRGGVAYFTSPLATAVTEGDAAEITVFDTTSTGVPLHVGGRHLIVGRPGPGGAREVLEVFELANDRSVTIVPPGGVARGVWSTPLPAAATNFTVRESSDVPSDGLVVVGRRATLMVPVAPGLKQVAFSYRLPDGAFPLRMPIELGTGVVEVLVEEPDATATGVGLAPVGPVALEGKSFRRFVAQNAAAGGVVEVAAGQASAASWPRYAVPALLAGVGGAMAGVLLLAGRRRGGVRPASSPPRRRAAPAAPVASAVGTSERDRLLTELAALDDAFAARPAPSDSERAAYDAQRTAIKGRLARELAAASGPG